jgi:hypothetical protein
VLTEQVDRDTGADLLDRWALTWKRLASEQGVHIDSVWAGISADDDVARILSILAVMTGPLLLLSFGLNVVMTFRHQRHEEAFAESVSNLKTTGERLDSMIVVEYQVTPDQAIEKLQDLSAKITGFAAYLLAHTPPAVLDPDADS